MKYKQPLVSVIIPTYNSSLNIEQTLLSVINQSWKNIEIIVIDDGSNDNTKDIVSKYTSNSLKLISQRNKGASASRNHGLKIATGEFIQFLDSDDILSENKIETQVKALLNCKEKVAVCDTVHFFNGTVHTLSKPSAYESNFLYSTDNPLNFLINLWGGNDGRGSMIQTNAWLVPKKIIDRNKPWQEYYSPDDDGEYFSRILLSSSGIIYTKDCYNYYRKFTNTKSLSDRSSKLALEGCLNSVMDKKLNLKEFINSETLKRGLANQLIGIAIQSYPIHRKLTIEILKELDSLNVKFDIPSIGGKKIDKISKYFGWRVARILQVMYNNSKKLTLK